MDLQDLIGRMHAADPVPLPILITSAGFEPIEFVGRAYSQEAYVQFRTDGDLKTYAWIATVRFGDRHLAHEFYACRVSKDMRPTPVLAQELIRRAASSSTCRVAAGEPV